MGSIIGYYAFVGGNFVCGTVRKCPCSVFVLKCVVQSCGPYCLRDDFDSVFGVFCDTLIVMYYEDQVVM